MSSTSAVPLTLYTSTTSAGYVFPTSITTTTGVVAAADSSSSSAAASTSSGSTYRSGSGLTNSAGTYFQTVIISLVALALLTVISALFIFYRRRRLASRYPHLSRSGLDPADWAFHATLFPGAAGAAARDREARRREKEEKDYGAVPIIWEVEVKEGDGVAREKGLKGGRDGEEMLDVSLDDVEAELDGEGCGRSSLGPADLPDLRPLSLGIITTAPPPSGKPTSSSSSSRPSAGSSRSASARARTYAYPGADEQYISARSRGRQSGKDTYPPVAGSRVGQGDGHVDGEEMVDVWTAAAPASVSFLIAMPQSPAYRAKQREREERVRRMSVSGAGGMDDVDDDEDHVLPDVAIGSIGLDLGQVTRETRKVSSTRPSEDDQWRSDEKIKSSRSANHEETDWEAMRFRADEEAGRSSRTTITTGYTEPDNHSTETRIPKAVNALNKEELVKLRLQLGLSAEAVQA